jgi:hypothetical protein
VGSGRSAAASVEIVITKALGCGKKCCGKQCCGKKCCGKNAVEKNQSDATEFLNNIPKTATNNIPTDSNQQYSVLDTC